MRRGAREAAADSADTLYTSGTTASPKGVVRLTGGNAVALRYAMEHTMGCTPKSTFFCASDVGWVVGHVFIVLAPLLLGCATVLFEGKPILPDAGACPHRDQQLAAELRAAASRAL